MSEHRFVPLSDIARVVRGVTFKKGDASDDPIDGGVPILRAGNIKDRLATDRDLVWLPAKFVSADQRLRVNDVAMCTSSGSADVVGKSARLEQPWEGSVGAFCAVIRSNEDVCLPDFLAHFLRTDQFRAWTRASSGANIKNIRKSELEQFPIPLPPLNEQRRIVDILNRAASIERLRARASSHLRDLIPALFIRMFGDPIDNPMGWGVKPLGDYIVDGPQNGLYRPKSDYGTGTRILRIDGFYDGKTVEQDAWQRLRISDEDAGRYALREDDIVINRVNSRPYLGKSTIIPELNEPAVFESNMMRMGVDPERLHPRFLIEQLQLNSVRDLLRANAKDAINQASINQTDVRSLRILVPPIALQERFIALTARAIGCHALGHIAATRAAELSAALMDRAFDASTHSNAAQHRADDAA